MAAPDPTSIDLDPGSGIFSPCDGPLSLSACPSQCVWCTEARLCTDRLQDCFLNPPQGDADDHWFAWLPLGLVLCAVCYGWLYFRQPPHSATAGADDSMYQLGGVVSDNAAAAEASNASSIELGESETLLSAGHSKSLLAET